MILYDYFRSTACYRVRIALHIKNIAFEKKTIQLVNNGGEQHEPKYQDINPQGLVPSLDIGQGIILHQSLAIIEYLEESYPEIPLLPENSVIRAQLRALASLIACDMHPLNNLRVLNQLKIEFQATEDQITRWYHHWLKKGFDAFEKQLQHQERQKPVCIGKEVSLADICLIPQVYNALRFEFPMTAYPIINAINAYCLSLPAFQSAAP